jgi:hypothetical protein
MPVAADLGMMVFPDTALRLIQRAGTIACWAC